MDRAEAEWSRVLSNEPIDDLEAGIEQAGTLRSSLERQAASESLELAGPTGSDADRQSNVRARLAELRKQLDALERQTSEKEKLAAVRLAHRERIEAERKAAQAALLAIDNRLRDTRNDLSYRGERLSIIDPGVVPERPSSPNLPLNLAAALLLGLLFPLVYLALEMNYHQQRVLQALARDE